MPSLKDLHCFIELPDGKTQLRDFGTAYSDGCVESFVAVPGRPQPFAIRLLSSKFIAPGLAMFVFIDGVYQCNRNRQNLKLRKPPDRKSVVDFVVRQKEERHDDGTMIARDWNFERLNIISANEAPEACSPKVLENIRCIEVVVLRCAGMRSAKSANTKVKPMNLDGAGEMPDYHFSLDGAPNSPQPQYDDRAYEYIRSGNGYGASTLGSSHVHITNPTVSLTRTTQLPGGGFSTFEKSIRSAIKNDKAIPTWEKDRAAVAPTVWAAAETKISPRNIYDQSTPINKGHEKEVFTASISKGQEETSDYGWRVNDTVGFPGEWALKPEQVYQPIMDSWATQKQCGHSAKAKSWEQPKKPQDVVASDDSWQAEINGWSALQKPKALENESNPWTNGAELNDQPTKSRSKYRQLRSPATETAATRHRHFPSPTPEQKRKALSGKECMEAEPLLKVLHEESVKKGIEHQVRAGKGAKYGHAIGRPEYLDSLEKPVRSFSYILFTSLSMLTQTQYAVFRFKYRAHGTLRKLLGKEVVPSDAALLTTSPINPLGFAQPNTSAQIHDVKQQLKKVPKDALINGLLELQTKLETKEEVAQTDTAGMNRTRDWVKRQSREASVNGKQTEARGRGGSWSSDDRWH
ncbi:hypothetical protein SLS60_005226 [Paraconiothyrium brasiliense]|uniref:Uncharacterized protein n=1 Tax=Paraconiothyrium brasiliense TaxID=300254 RepID=A0ABR3RGR8_9PLEO